MPSSRSAQMQTVSSCAGSHASADDRRETAEKFSPPLEANVTAMRVFAMEAVATEVSKRSGENSRRFGGKLNWRRNRPGTNPTICYPRGRRIERVVRCYECNRAGHIARFCAQCQQQGWSMVNEEEITVIPESPTWTWGRNRSEKQSIESWRMGALTPTQGSRKTETVRRLG